MAMSHYATPRMTRDIDLVVAFYHRDVERVLDIFSPDYYVAPEAALTAVLHQTSFNVIYQRNLIKVDLMIRKNEEYRKTEFGRKKKVIINGLEGQEIWIVSKEDLILSKLDWAKDSLSAQQLMDVVNLIASGCDWEYLKLWSTQLHLTDMLTRVTPSETPPPR